MQARKRVAAMKADGAAMRELLQAGVDIHTVGGIDLRALEQAHLDKITKIQANVRGHLARKHMLAPLSQAPHPEQVCPHARVRRPQLHGHPAPKTCVDLSQLHRLPFPEFSCE